MNRHLSDEQFTRFLAAGEDTSAQAHLAECAPCREQAARLLQIVGVARAGAERGTDRHANEWARQRNAVRDALQRRPPRPRWALAAALALLVLVSTFLFRAQAPRTEPLGQAQMPHNISISDDALLSAVDSTLEQSVPSALVPLQELAYEREQAERNKKGQN